MSNKTKRHVQDAYENKQEKPGQSAPKRRSEEKRIQNQNTFADNIRDPQTKPAMDRRAKRKTLADISAPKRQTNVSAMRFVLKASDIFWVSALIFIGLWNAYIGINNRGFIAPIAAGLIGAISFIAMLFSVKAHQLAILCLNFTSRDIFTRCPCQGWPYGDPRFGITTLALLSTSQTHA